ncbi:MAG: glycosyltransferase [Melioribacteraceae bacterium]|nr:glycosyltransferase [Melioribacteraceae bacterium]
MQLYNTKNPSVSIILPTFNRSKLVERAVNSVINQSFSDWELLIIDDGSSDLTFQVIDKYLMNDQRIRYMKHKNRKLPFSLNAGILASSGKYITFLGSDDEYKVEHLKLRYDFLEGNPKIDFLHGGVKIIGDEFVKDRNDLTKSVHLSECIIGGTFMGKKEVFIELDGFENLAYSEDFELFERAKKKFRIEKVNYETYIYHREHGDSITNSI